MTPDDPRRRSIEETLKYAARSGAWIVARRPAVCPVPVEEEPADLPILSSPEGGKLVAIREKLGDCTRCRLHQGRTHIVFGVGDPNARLVFVGEGPGEEEDKKGEPFVGRAGKLLDKMIAAIGLERCQVYIANVIKCRPPGNRDPREDEIGTCSPFLWDQLDALKPALVVALGAHAARSLTGSESPIGALRGRVHKRGGSRCWPPTTPPTSSARHRRSGRRGRT